MVVNVCTRLYTKPFRGHYLSVWLLGHLDIFDAAESSVAALRKMSHPPTTK